MSDESDQLSFVLDGNRKNNKNENEESLNKLTYCLSFILLDSASMQTKIKRISDLYNFLHGIAFISLSQIEEDDVSRIMKFLMTLKYIILTLTKALMIVNKKEMIQNIMRIMIVCLLFFHFYRLNFK